MVSTSLTIILIILTIIITSIITYFLLERSIKARIKAEREDAVKRSRVTLGGQFAEQLAPYLPDFPFSPTEARFIGKPIDFIVFKGADTKEITDVIFVEVKSGNAKINQHEKNLKDVITNKHVKWQEYRIPKDITTKR